MDTPYSDALALIDKAPDTSAAQNLAKLILSLHSDACAYSLRECLANVDEKVREVSLSVIEHFALSGPEPRLAEVGRMLAGRYPALWEAGRAMATARDLRLRHYTPA